MSVKVACTGCGKSFNAPDQYAGKKVKCKVCGTAFRVPGPAAETPRAGMVAKPSPVRAAAAPRSSAAAAATRKPEPVAAPVPADDDQGEYDLSGDDWSTLQPAAPAPTYAPSTVSPAAAPVYAPPTGAPAGRGTMFPSTAQPMSARHNAVADGQGMHWLMKVQIGAFALPVLLLVLGKMIPAMATAGILLASLVAMAFILWGQIGVLMTAAQEGGVCVLLYLFIPFYPIYFILTRFEEVSHHVIRTVAGFALMFGAIMMILSQQSP